MSKDKPVDFRFTHIDCFTALDDLPKKMHGNSEAVLRALKTSKRLSSWDLQDSAVLAMTVQGLELHGDIKLTDIGYPWYSVEFSEGRT